MDQREHEDEGETPITDTARVDARNVDRARDPLAQDTTALLRSLDDVSAFVDSQAHGF